jgi:hypothetical protein
MNRIPNVFAVLLVIATLVFSLTTVYYYYLYSGAIEPYRGAMPFKYSGAQPSMYAEEGQVFICYSPGFEKYADAALQISDTAMKNFRTYYGMVCPSIQIFFYMNANQTALINTYNYRIYWYLLSADSLRPPPNGPYHIYGFCQAIAKMMFWFDNGSFTGGWAFYAGSEIVDRVHSALGDNAWPQPYDYSATEGSERLIESIKEPKRGSDYAAAKILCTLEMQYGAHIFNQALVTIEPSMHRGMYHFPIYNLNDFKKALVQVTHDKTIMDIFSENGF